MQFKIFLLRFARVEKNIKNLNFSKINVILTFLRNKNKSLNEIQGYAFEIYRIILYRLTHCI